MEQTTVLYAEDDEQVRKFVLRLLLAKGYNVLVAEDGAQALAKALAFTGAIALLLSDIEMPGMTGIELAIQINAVKPNVKILLTSGLPSGTLVLNNGWQFLPKPFEGRMLMDRVRDVIGD
jgi:DNA-binding response OmpR family regulator